MAPGWYREVCPPHPTEVSCQSRHGSVQKAGSRTRATALLFHQPQLPPVPPSRGSRSRERTCPQPPGPGVILLAGTASPGPSPSLRGAGRSHRNPFGPIQHGPAPSSPLHIPTSPSNVSTHACCQSPRKELTRNSSVYCLLRKAHLFPSPPGRRRLSAFPQELWDQFDTSLLLSHDGE